MQLLGLGVAAGAVLGTPPTKASGVMQKSTFGLEATSEPTVPEAVLL